MTELGRTILSTQNEEWGFFGTVQNQTQNTKKTTEAWNVASILIKEIAGFKPYQIRDFLDSRWGRHMADEFFVNAKDKEFNSYFQKKYTKQNLEEMYEYYVDDKEFKRSTPNRQHLFCKELAKLSKKYGIVLQSVGGVFQNAEGFIRYNNDLDSGDLMPIWEDD